MQIKFNNVLLAGKWTEATKDLSRDVGENVQVAEYIEGSEPKFIPRGSHKSGLSFSTHRYFDSILKAELFFLEHGDTEGTNTPTELTGIAEFFMEDETGNATRWARGMLTIRINPPQGVSITTNYTLTIGRILTAKPTD